MADKSNVADKANLPPPILTSEPGSFARNTLAIRIPRIVDDTIAANDFAEEIVQALRALRDEITGGVIQPLREDAPDRAFWDAQARPYIGRSWLDVPWYWAEAFFYRRVLEATRYFQPGATYRCDPFANLKRGELAPDRGLHALRVLIENLPHALADRFRALLHASLWGNRTDLSYPIARDAPGALALERERAHLLVDDTARVWQHLGAQRGGRIAFICDNAGTELLFDLALAHFLLGTGLAQQVVFHLKPQPFFVSDAMIADARAALDALAQSAVPTLRLPLRLRSGHGSGRALQRLAQRLGEALAERRWVLTDHWFWTSSLFFFEMPADLRTTLAQANLVIAKGDANYRRLLGDAHWAPTTPFESAVAYFPAPLVALRTFKAELIVGLRPGDAERLQAEDPAWLVNGRRGVIQFKR